MKFSSKNFKIFVWILIIVLAIFLLNLFHKETKSFFYSISSPIEKVLWKTGQEISSFFKTMTRIKDLKNEAKDLKFKNQELTFEIVALERLKEENDFLRKAVDIELQKDFKLVLTQIIGKDISQDYILINKGSNDGILKDMPVITEQKVFVGRISEVYKNFSKVMLISSSNSYFDAKIKGKDISGIVKRKGD